MKYNKVNVVKKIAFLLMTMALAVVMVACQAAAPGKAGAPGAPGEPAPRLPYLNTGFADVELSATGEMATRPIILAGHFVDPHEGALTYSASSPSDVVETSVSGSTLTLTAVKEGTATVTVGAENKDGASAFNPGAQFTVTVMETVAPIVKEGGIPDQTLYKDDSPVALTLTKADADSMGYFTHGSAITYDVSSSPVGVVTAVEAEGVLTLTPLVTGQTIVTVVATAESRNTDPVTFTVNVEEGPRPTDPDPTDPDPTDPDPTDPDPMGPDPTDPDPMGPDPMGPEPEGSIGNIDALHVGDTREVPVADNFSDPDEQMLTFSAETDDTAVATVMTSDSTVTVTAKGGGMAMITVTATDEDGLTAIQKFMVTVMVGRRSITLDVGVPKDVNVLPGRVVRPADEDILLVSKKDISTYIVRAIKKGGTTLEVYEDNDLRRTIDVTVRNRAPVLSGTEPATAYTLLAATSSDLTADDLKDIGGYSAVGELYKIDGQFDLDTFFNDPDVDDEGNLKFDVRSSRPNHVVIAAIEYDGGGIYVDVLDASINSFKIIVMASDRDATNSLKAASSIELSVAMMPPLSHTYAVDQNDYDLSDGPVGFRNDSTDMLNFEAGTMFAGDTAVTNLDIIIGKPDSGSEANYAMVTTSNNIEFVADGTGDQARVFDNTVTEMQMLSFKTKSSGDAWVKIAFHEWDEPKYKSAKEMMITFKVVTVSEKIVILKQQP